MGRTNATITELFQQEKAALARFRRALRRSDQTVFDELLADAQQHLAAAGYASHLSPFESILLAMLLEERKLSNRQYQLIQDLYQELGKLQQENDGNHHRLAP